METRRLVVAFLLVATLISMVCMVNATSDNPLYLTPLIDKGNATEAKTRSRVTAKWTGTVESYAGYFTVNAIYNSNLFFWFFPTKTSNAPLLLWLNGGPGVSSMVGALIENGPLVLTRNQNGDPVVGPRQEHAWTEQFHMLYVDSPGLQNSRCAQQLNNIKKALKDLSRQSNIVLQWIPSHCGIAGNEKADALSKAGSKMKQSSHKVGTGFSFTDNEAGYAKLTKRDVVPSLYKLLIQFYKVFPEYRSNPFFAGGQSYAGKYIPVLGRYIHDQNQETPEIKVPLKGIYVGAGLCHGKVMLPEMARSLYYAGFMSSTTRQKIITILNDFMSRSINQRETNITEFSSVTSLLWKLGDGSNGYLLGSEHTTRRWWRLLSSFMNRNSTREALHVKGRRYRTISSRAWSTLVPKDFFIDTLAENSFLMENYKVLHYSGSFDYTVSVAMTEAFLKRVQWNGRSDYIRHANKLWWSANNRVIGWFAHIRNLTRVIVRNAGHDTPLNKPEITLEMMTNFVFDRSFNRTT